MIFVTVGTTMPFDGMVEAVDRLAGDGLFDEPVLFQIGNGTYEPQHGEWFRSRLGIDDLIAEASFVFGHGGTGTTLGLMRAEKAFLSVANPMGADDHQAHFLRVIERQCGIVWTADLSRLGELYAKARTKPYRPLATPRLADAILGLVRELPPRA